MEAQEPVKGEFLAIVQDQDAGNPGGRGRERMSERYAVAEANFLPIVVAFRAAPAAVFLKRSGISPRCCGSARR